MSLQDSLLDHLGALARSLEELRRHTDLLDRFGSEAAARLSAGHRLLAVGNGGSAAHAQHLTSELVGRFDGERRPLSAIALHAEPSALTAIVNDYGPGEMFARQVRAHGRPGDLLVAFSTSGTSDNVLRAVDAARDGGLRTFAFTGAAPNPLASCTDVALTVDADRTAVVQDVHQVAIHLLCTAIDARFDVVDRRPVRRVIQL